MSDETPFYMRRYICNMNRYLKENKDDQLAIGDIINTSGYRSDMKDVGNKMQKRVAINIDNLPDDVIKQIYDFMSERVRQLEQASK